MIIKQRCMENMGIYADKKPKVSSKNGRKKSSSSVYYSLPDVNYQRALKTKDDENSNRHAYSKDSEARIKYLMEKYRKIVHYDSPEPERYGVRAFTKNSEIYIAPGGESALPHELAHVYQQKTQSIPATGEINGEKVNTDSKLEKEADEISKNIGSNIPKVIIYGKRQATANNVMQFAPPDKEGSIELENEESEASKMSFDLMTQKLSTFITNLKKHPHLALTGGIASVTAGLIYWLRSRLKEQKRISAIDEMLQTEEIFKTNIIENGYFGIKEIFYTLEQAMSLFTAGQKQSINKNIRILKNCCDAKGIVSVLKSASENDTHELICPGIEDFWDENETDDEKKTEKGKEIQQRLAGYFIKRLELMTKYVEDVNKKFKGKYWIRSTGSDPHKDGEHALFLVNKTNQTGYENDTRKKAGEIAKVYKPHDLSADNAIVGKEGIFSEVNDIIKKDFKKKLYNLDLIKDSEEEDIFATMDIDVEHHTEEFITKKSEMTSIEAKKYFFRAGMLKVITDAMAVIDLHQDNIMPTLNGPMIIDAEVDFFEYTKSGLEEAGLAYDRHNGRSANSSFIIKDSDKIKNSTAAFNERGEYYNYYISGYNFMREEMKKDANKDNHFVNIYRKKLENFNDSKIRILPLKTSDFANALRDIMLETSKKKQQYIITTLAVRIEENLCKKYNTNKSEYNFIFDDNLTVQLDKNKLEDAIEETFKNGTIIAMYIDITGKIFLDETQVGNVLNLDDKPITKEDMIKTMKERFLKVINELPERSPVNKK